LKETKKPALSGKRITPNPRSNRWGEERVATMKKAFESLKDGNDSILLG